MASTRQRTTLATVAASAGVSIATVSKVLNGRDDVSAATRARVQEMLREHEYSGRLSATDRQPTVELTFRGRIGAYSAEIIQGVAGAADELGAAVTLSHRLTHEPVTRSGAADWARGLAVNGRHAVIAVTDELGQEEITALARMRLPLVVIDPMNLPGPGLTSVGSTNFRGGLAATRHLLALGHRRIALLGGLAGAECSQARLQGFKAALDEAGVPLAAHHVEHAGDFMYDHGVVSAPLLLDHPDRPTAIFATSDELARGVIEAARTRGLAVPGDLSVIGFDDTEVARMASPPLTTVRQPLREMGAVALRTALRLAAGDQIDSDHVELATELVVRDTTAAPASDVRG